MNAFEVDLQKVQLDLPLCVSSGQVFRWRETSEGQWVGVDGSAWYRVDSRRPSRLVVETNATEDQFRSLFRLDEPVDIERIRSIGPELSPYIDGLPGLTVMRPSDAVEETFCFLCTANNHLSRITKMVQTLASYGEEMGQDLYIFPSIEQIASLSESELRAKGFGYRGRTIPEIARQMIERGGQEWLEGLRGKPYEEAHRSLVEIKGIGPKLADCICLFALHHTEAVPVDTHLWQAAVRHYFPEWKGKSLTESRYRAIGDSFRDRFGKLAGFAHQYLFYDNMRNWRAYRKG